MELQAPRPRGSLHFFPGVHVGLEVVHARPEVERPVDGTGEPVVARIHEPEDAPRALRRQLDERLRIGIAADDPVHGDDVGRWNLRGDLHEVPVAMGDALTISHALRFLVGGPQERR